MDNFEKLYREYFQYVHFYLLRLCGDRELAEELTQETFFAALKSKEHFRYDSEVRTWLCKIGKNKYFEKLRKEKKLDLGDFDGERADNFDLQASLVDKEDALTIHRILHQLPEPYKEVFSLRTFGELSFGEIGRIFGKSDGWARVTYGRAKLKIIEKMKEEGHEL